MYQLLLMSTPVVGKLPIRILHYFLLRKLSEMVVDISLQRRNRSACFLKILLQLSTLSVMTASNVMSRIMSTMEKSESECSNIVVIGEVREEYQENSDTKFNSCNVESSST
ncbi:hypothetical protein L9F63_004954, partial [Diploptera punctata]